MDAALNPYAPGAGSQPPELAGRDEVLRRADIALDRLLGGRPARGQMLLGLRGVGKTVLLNKIHRSARDKNLQTVRIEAPEGGRLARLLTAELRRVLYDLDLSRRAGAKLRSAWNALRNFASIFRVSFEGFDFGVDPTPGVADTGDLVQDLPQLLTLVAEAARDRNTAVVLFIDEVQYLDPQELAAVIVACHRATQDDAPLLFVGAGLPQLAALAGNAKSYAERLFDYPEIGPLSDEAAKLAIAAPADREGVVFTDNALTLVRDFTRNYPYFIQEWASHAWNAAEASPIGEAIIRAVTPSVIAHLDANFFRVRLDRLTSLQQKYLRAMAELGPGPYKTGDIAAALQCEPSSVAPTRSQLIKLGMIWSQRHGETAFTVPLFDEFMKRQIPVLEPHIPNRRKR